MSYNCKNYTAHGGNETVIGGKLTNLHNVQSEGLSELLDMPERGGLTAAANLTDSTATRVAGLKDDFNALLAKLKVPGIITADSPAEMPEE